jgi:hypothetical protein
MIMNFRSQDELTAGQRSSVRAEVQCSGCHHRQSSRRESTSWYRLAGRLIHLPEDSGLRLGVLWLADTNGLLSLANRVVYLLLKGASFGLAFRWRIGKFLAICNCIEDIFMIFSQGTLFVRFPSPP